MTDLLEYNLVEDMGWHAQTLWYAAYEAKQYVSEHEIPTGNFQLQPQQVMQLACARLQWLLERVRPSLSGLFSEDDFYTLLDCYQADLFIPSRLHWIPSDLCDHHAIELDEYPSSWLAALVDKLRALDVVQNLALADAIEQAWHRGITRGLAPSEFLPTLGIGLAGG